MKKPKVIRTITLSLSLGALIGAIDSPLNISKVSTPVSYSTPGMVGFGAVPSAPMPQITPTSVVIGAATTHSGAGEWYATANGQVITTGDANSYGDLSQTALNSPIIAFVPTPDQRGYWMAASDGAVYAFGDAKNYGDLSQTKLNGPIVAMLSTPSGGGYWLVATDGGVFTFGDARFYGSMGGQHLNAAVVGAGATPSGLGYWLAASDGGVFTFGDAPFYGSMGGQSLNAQVMAMAPTSDGKGYWLVANDGGVFTFGDARFYGSLGSALPNTPISSIIPSPNNLGYWLLSPDSFKYSFSTIANERTFSNSSAIVAAAQSQVGPVTSGGFCNPYGPCEEWCALFSSWVWNRGGVPSVSDGFTGDLYNWAATHTNVISGTSTPAAGDIAFYGTSPANTATSVHAGVVVQVWPDGSIITVEGDSGPGPDGYLGVTINGPFQAGRSTEVNGDPIYGYGEPQ
ncbi:CHAP domain-containing protein [Acidithrix sp. C25]|uniref:CHAP domain-containing protein n=1 Tax=Acidithrix sp. C25 TaxID=1671482 RepID=UPI00191BBF49|nr:CHAP domain-containing protein [Acidithrix sp. C25]CAG4901558.1 unnamed protein product [Acidithrix sp. C25]